MPFDDTYHLDDTTRAHVAPKFDPDALERFLQHFGPEERPIVLEFFLLNEYRSHPYPPNTDFHMIGSSDSELGALLAEVWQPFWDAQPDEMLDEPGYCFPGQALARQRRNKHS